MPNKEAKQRKRLRRLKNKELNRDGRTANQVKRNRIKVERRRKERELS